MHQPIKIQKMEMKPKRPRLQNARINAERQENSVLDTVSTGHIGPIEDNGLSERGLSDMEFIDLKQEKTYEPVVLADFHLEPDLKQSDVSEDENTAEIKDIYKTIEFDPGF
jgi:hypothetical protein